MLLDSIQPLMSRPNALIDFTQLRKAITGAEAGPDLGGLAEAVGKKAVLGRLDRVLA